MKIATQLTLPPEPVVESIDWQYRPEDAEAHAFGEGRGWLRAKCRRIPLTIALVDAPASFPRCVDCLAIVGPAPVAEAV